MRPALGTPHSTRAWSGSFEACGMIVRISVDTWAMTDGRDNLPTMRKRSGNGTDLLADPTRRRIVALGPGRLTRDGCPRRWWPARSPQ